MVKDNKTGENNLHNMLINRKASFIGTSLTFLRIKNI